VVSGSRFANEASSIPKLIFKNPDPSLRSVSSGTCVPSGGTGIAGSSLAIIRYISGNCVPVASTQERSIAKPIASAAKSVG